MGNTDYSTIRREMRDIAQDELSKYQANQNPPDDIYDDKQTKTTQETPKTRKIPRLRAQDHLMTHTVTNVAATVAETAATVETTSATECPNANRDETPKELTEASPMMTSSFQRSQTFIKL